MVCCLLSVVCFCQLRCLQLVVCCLWCNRLLCVGIDVVVSCLTFLFVCWLSVVRCALPAAWCSLRVARCVLIVGCCLLFVVCLLFPVCRCSMWFVVRSL